MALLHLLLSPLHHRTLLSFKTLVSAALWALAALMTPTASAAAQPQAFVINNEPHLQHAYALVQAALQASGITNVQLVNGPPANQKRLLYQITHGHTHIDMLPASKERLQLLKEGKLRLIPIPLDRGLLGWRVGLVLKRDAHKLAHVRTVADLAQFTIGQNMGWTDLEIYSHAGIPIKETKRWSNGEFAEQMEQGFFDLFPLGLEEAHSYFLPHFQLHAPQLIADQHLLIRYPWFRFVWIHASPDTEALYAALVRGFDLLATNGEFLRIWSQYRTPPPAHLYQQRTLIDLPNPLFDHTIIPQHYQHLLLSPTQP